jgi:hypothetical protein
MAVKIGNIDISTVGSIKIGSTNVTKVYLGTTQIFPVGVTYYLFASSYSESSSSSSACSNSLVSNNLYTTNSNGIVDVGDTIYIFIEGEYYPYTGDFDYVSYNEGSTRKVLNIDNGTGEILSKSNCGSSSFEYEVRLGNSNSEACSAFTETVYSDSSTFAVGMVLYTTSALTTVVTGYTRVVDEAFNPYILDTTLGVVGSQIGSC